MFQHINKDMAGGSRAATDQYNETIQLDLRVIIAVVMNITVRLSLRPGESDRTASIIERNTIGNGRCCILMHAV